MQQSMTGPDYGTNFGIDVFGIPGLNADGRDRPGLGGSRSATAACRVFSTGLSALGNNSTWTPVWRDERSYTISTNLTKVAGRHEIRTGFDFVRLRLTHWQPEVGNPRGVLTFGGGITGIPGYAGVGGWNGYAAFLLGEMSNYAKSEQFEELSGRENQYGLYVADRWQVNEKLTLNLGLRYEYYPLMTRQDRGIELLDVNTFNVRLGGLGGNPQDLGIDVSKTLFAPRFGAAYRLNERHGVPRRLRQDVHAAAVVAPDARTVSVDDCLQRRRRERLHPLRQRVQRDPRRAESGHLDRQRSAPARRGHDALPIRTISRGARRSRGTRSSNAACRWTSPSASATSARAPTASTRAET